MGFRLADLISRRHSRDGLDVPLEGVRTPCAFQIVEVDATFHVSSGEWAGSAHSSFHARR